MYKFVNWLYVIITKVMSTSRCKYILLGEDSVKNQATAALKQTYTDAHLGQIITCFRTDEFLRPLHRGRERNSTLSLCLQRKSIYNHNSGNALFVHTDTYAHVLRISINSDRENNNPGCQEIRLKHSYGICECECVCVCEHISFLHHTYLARQQSVF